MKRALFIAALLATGIAQAAPQGLDELLRQVQQSNSQQAKQNQEREQRFLRNKAEQAAELAKAEANLAVVQGRVNGVKARYEANQKAMADLKAQLSARAGDYQQVYATVKSASADFRAVAAGSLVSAQVPQRMEFLDRMAEGREIPSVGDLEKLWFTLQEEMTEGGKVARFQTEILDRDGAPKKTEVVRVGTFTAMSGGEYLALEGGRLATLAEQPKSEYLSLADDFEEESSGYEPIMVDPSRGSLLELEGERPGMMDRVHQGGMVGYVIIVVALIGFVLAVYQMLYLYRVNAKVIAQLGRLSAPSDDNPLGRVLLSLKDAKAPRPDEDATDAEVLELRLSEAVLRETPKLERFQSLIRLIVAAGPLLGLLGTVGGMIITFQVITELGAGDPKAMARGISQAMIATVLGLGEAIPLLFINAYLASRSKALVQILDEQSAGMLARSLEARKAA